MLKNSLKTVQNKILYNSVLLYTQLSHANRRDRHDRSILIVKVKKSHYRPGHALGIPGRLRLTDFNSLNAELNPIRHLLAM
jgi:hypothetical protein